ncbi:cyclase [Rhizobiales bacterium]|uniref:cyclase n=1 Tax=Hongsoonwoonella zoysiae TaxID=2821844 RepID=UPI00156167C4|nr:cyclase [Hongsoonwoonella zoysiae]NRG17121.1 cyclase [Hongsoonwoonella zoysiae]
MIRLFVRHTVKDFDAWKAGYDKGTEFRKDWGVLDHAVYRSSDDPNDITVMHDFDTLEHAKKFASSEGLAERMRALGVSSPVQIWFAHESS